MDERLSNPALKEWAVICDALADGSQIVDLRKGGIHERDRRFAIRAERFWLYPSFEHQRADLLTPAGIERLERVDRARPPAGELRIEAWADLLEAARITERAQVEALADGLVWTADYAEQRLRWKPKHPLWVLVLRVHRLEEPLRVPVRDEYGGCSSWVPMRDLPHDPRSVPSRPALDEADFEARRRAIHAALRGVIFDPAGAEPVHPR